jgi:hypothetical protein
LVPVPKARTLGLRVLTPAIDVDVALPFQADVQQAMYVHGAVVVQQSVVGRPLLVGQQLFSGLASTSAKVRVSESLLEEVQMERTTLHPKHSIVQRIN